MVEEKTKEEKITEEIQLKTTLMKVKSKVKDNVTEDYVLATLTQAEKDFIIENYQNAEFAKEIIERFANKGYVYKFNDKNMDWERDEDGEPKRIYLTDDIKKRIKSRADRIFEFFMVKPHMITILSRNKKDNYMLGLLGKDDEKKEEVDEVENSNILQRLKKKLLGEENEKEE